MTASTDGEIRVAPMLPLKTLRGLVSRDRWNASERRSQFTQARGLQVHDFVQPVLYLKELFFNDGFYFHGAQDPQSKLAVWLNKTGFSFSKIVDDIWLEWLLQDNVVAFWNEPETKKEIPTVTVLDCEDCLYSNAFGVELLKIRPPKVTLNAQTEKELRDRGMPDRYIDAIKNGKEFTVNEGEGERFRVLSRAKMGKGLCPPRLGSILEPLSTMDLLGLGDWSAAYQMKKVIRQFKKGIAYTQGPLAGDARHFMKSKDQTAMQNAQKNRDGAYDIFTNVDVSVNFPFMDPRYFDEKKYEGTLARLDRWAGPLSLMFRAGQVSPFAMDMFGAEGRRQRQKVGEFVNDIFNHPDFIGKNKPPEPLRACWNPRSFTSAKMLRELVQLGVSNGLMSPQTGRETLELDDVLEGDRMEAASKKRDRYTPPFEGKQGLVKNSGRPPQSGHPADGDVST